MSQVAKTNIPDPHNAVSSRVISDIVSSPEQWAAWNAALEQALNQSPDKGVIENVRATAAVYAYTQRSFDTTHQGRHTLALYRAVHSKQDNHQRMSFSMQDIAAGFWRGISNWVEKKITPGDMNLEHSQNRSDPMRAFLDLPKTIPQRAEKLMAVTERVVDEPSLVTKAGKLVLENTSQFIDAKSKEMVLTAVVAPNPVETSGEIMGVLAVETATELAMNINPLGRASKTIDAVDGAVDAVQDVPSMDMQLLGKVMGEGSVPPTPPRMLDLSDREHSYLVKLSGLTKFDYKPELTHFILGSVDDGIMEYMIRAGGDRTQSGYAKEMFLTMVETFKQNGVKINQIDDHWPAWNAMTTNNHQFWHHVDNGESLENAARKTFTGQRAAEIGLSDVSITDEVRAIVKKNERHLGLDVSFNKPLSNDPEIQSRYDYANAWQSSMGRRSVELFKDGVGEKPDYMQKLTHPADFDRDDAISHGLNGDDLSP